MTDRVGERLDRIRADHDELRRELAAMNDAVAALECAGDLAGIETMLGLLRAERDQHFGLEEELANEVLGPEARPVLSLQADHRDLRERIGRVEAALGRARSGGGQAARDDLWEEAVALLQNLTCHLCREESGLVAFIQLFAEPGAAPDRIAPPRPHRPLCHR